MFRIFRSTLASIANLTNEPPKTPYRRDAYFQSDVDYNLHRWFGGKRIERPNPHIQQLSRSQFDEDLSATRNARVAKRP